MSFVIYLIKYVYFSRVFVCSFAHSTYKKLTYNGDVMSDSMFYHQNYSIDFDVT